MLTIYLKFILQTVSSLAENIMFNWTSSPALSLNLIFAQPTYVPISLILLS